MKLPEDLNVFNDGVKLCDDELTPVTGGKGTLISSQTVHSTEICPKCKIGTLDSVFEKYTNYSYGKTICTHCHETITEVYL